MFDHKFKIVPHYRIGPLRNAYGFIIAVAEIGEVWLLRCETPNGENHTTYFSTHDDVIAAIRVLNGLDPEG